MILWWQGLRLSGNSPVSMQPRNTLTMVSSSSTRSVSTAFATRSASFSAWVVVRASATMHSRSASPASIVTLGIPACIPPRFLASSIDRRTRRITGSLITHLFLIIGKFLPAINHRRGLDPSHRHTIHGLVHMHVNQRAQDQGTDGQDYPAVPRLATVTAASPHAHTPLKWPPALLCT